MFTEANYIVKEKLINREFERYMRKYFKTLTIDFSDDIEIFRFSQELTKDVEFMILLGCYEYPFLELFEATRTSDPNDLIAVFERVRLDIRKENRGNP